MSGEQQQVNQQPEAPAANLVGTLDAAVEAELAELEKRDGPTDGSQDDNQADDQDATDDANDDAQDDEGSEEGDGKDADADQVEAKGEVADFELNGKTFKVPKEIVPNLMMDADYRQKTMQIADYGRQLQQREQDLGQLFSAADVHAQGRARVASIDAEGTKIYAELNANPSMENENPAQFWSLSSRLNLLNIERNRAIGSVQQAEQAHSKYMEQRREEQVRIAQPILESVGIDRSALHRIAQYLPQTGLNAEVQEYLNSGASPAAVLLLEKARRYDEIMAKTGDAKKQVNSAKPIRPVAKPGNASNETRGANTAQLGKRLAATGSMSDAVALELAHMERPRGRRNR